MTPTASHNRAQGQLRGAAVERHPGLPIRTTANPERVVQPLAVHCRTLSGFVCWYSQTQGGAATPLTLGYDV